MSSTYVTGVQNLNRHLIFKFNHSLFYWIRHWTESDLALDAILIEHILRLSCNKKNNQKLKYPDKKGPYLNGSDLFIPTSNEY